MRYQKESEGILGPGYRNVWLFIRHRYLVYALCHDDLYILYLMMRPEFCQTVCSMILTPDSVSLCSNTHATNTLQEEYPDI